MILLRYGLWCKTLGWGLALSVSVEGVAFGQTLETVRFSYGLGRDALPAVVAIEEGYFFREGLNVSGLPVSSMATAIQSLKNGATDFATLPARGVMLIGQMQLPVRIVALSGWGLTVEILVAIEGEGYKSLKDLRGKVIGIDLESEGYPHFIRYLAILGMDHSWFRILHVDPSELEEALKRRRVEAAVVPRHVGQGLVEGKIARRLVGHEEFSRVTKGVNPSALVVRKAIVDTRPQVVERFVRAWVQGLRFLATNLHKASDLLRLFYERQGLIVPADIVRSWVSLARYDRCTWQEADSLDVEYSAWALKQVGILPEITSVASIVDNRFVRLASKNC